MTLEEVGKKSEWQRSEEGEHRELVSWSMSNTETKVGQH